MDLTLNEMRALHALVSAASAKEHFIVSFNDIPQATERQEILVMYLRDINAGHPFIGGKWDFQSEQRVRSLAARLSDLIGDEERHQRNTSKMAYAAWLSALAAAVSAIATLVALLH